jgi:hypothetical protein
MFSHDCCQPPHVEPVVFQPACTTLFCLQVTPYELLRSLVQYSVEPAVMEVAGVKVTADMALQ